ncbi:hypothetical protein V6N12_036344 [Hibiscus sabdariffa]|uniref:OST48 N-terminal domain-containing protein n=1 Tax=Hibiscus sabdariffa TaxID=183260 RepID=A0ABR2EQV5_9ROSI
MLQQGIKPDVVTFVALLSAFRHCGLVEMGERYFNSMKEVYIILPENDHCACMIDLYGRANRLDKALAFMKTISIEHDAAIMGAFLHACRDLEDLLSIDLAAIVDFVDSGHDLIIAADSNASDLIREVGTECGVDFDEDPSAMVIDHIGHAVSETEGDHTLNIETLHRHT